ncbi:unnamed protein product [Cylicocyclus nassatus]|uniref:arginine kinase n=1 Tax=Cylicocyclus nassatus TaxID=53992 RepID=A0AA36GLW5_CYLNA|nr:unnamed protein product [Cylicocyclus nassatus]
MRMFIVIRKRGAKLAVGILFTLGGVITLYTMCPQATSLLESSDGVDFATVRKIEEAYARLNGPQGVKCYSLLKKFLTKDVLEELKYKKTKLGATLYDCIRSGVYNLDAGVGAYAPDAEAYKTFAPLFDRIIEEYHGFSLGQKQPSVDLGDGKIHEFPPLDPGAKYIRSTRIRCGRAVVGYPFNPLLSEKSYLEIEEKLKRAFETFEDNELKGKYYPLNGMTQRTQKQLIDNHFLFKEDDRHLHAANAYRFWPKISLLPFLYLFPPPRSMSGTKGRGIYYNDEKTFLIWANEEDHVRIISMQKDSNVGQVLDRLNRGVKHIEKHVHFARDERLGWLTFCPTNLGSTVRASVHIKLPKLTANMSNFVVMCNRLNLQLRGVHGEHSEPISGVYDISNKGRLGISEYQAVKQMYDGVKELIRKEETL